MHIEFYIKELLGNHVATRREIKFISYPGSNHATYLITHVVPELC
jgi:hypothetical protein